MREERCAARVQGFDVTETQTMAAGVRRILNENGRLSLDAEKISDREDLFDAGMTSHAPSTSCWRSEAIRGGIPDRDAPPFHLRHRCSDL